MPPLRVSADSELGGLILSYHGPLNDLVKSIEVSVTNKKEELQRAAGSRLHSLLDILPQLESLSDRVETFRMGVVDSTEYLETLSQPLSTSSSSHIPFTSALVQLSAVQVALDQNEPGEALNLMYQYFDSQHFSSFMTVTRFCSIWERWLWRRISIVFNKVALQCERSRIVRNSIKNFFLDFSSFIDECILSGPESLPELEKLQMFVPSLYTQAVRTVLSGPNCLSIDDISQSTLGVFFRSEFTVRRFKNVPQTVVMRIATVATSFFQMAFDYQHHDLITEYILRLFTSLRDTVIEGLKHNCTVAAPFSCFFACLRALVLCSSSSAAGTSRHALTKVRSTYYLAMEDSIREAYMDLVNIVLSRMVPAVILPHLGAFSRVYAEIAPNEPSPSLVGRLAKVTKALWDFNSFGGPEAVNSHASAYLHSFVDACSSVDAQFLSLLLSGETEHSLSFGGAHLCVLTGRLCTSTSTSSASPGFLSKLVES